MAVLERMLENENIVDDSLPLRCSFDNYRLVDGHTVRTNIKLIMVLFSLLSSFLLHRSTSLKSNAATAMEKAGPYLNDTENLSLWTRSCIPQVSIFICHLKSISVI